MKYFGKDSELMCTKKRNERFSEIPIIFSLYKHESKGRGEIEEYIFNMYMKAFNASLDQFMPVLLVLESEDNKCLGSLGIREAGDAMLFLERYLDSSIENVLHRCLRDSCSRHEIVEVGNLVTSFKGGSAWLIASLMSWSYYSSYKWVICTATKELRNRLLNLGIKLYFLANARAEHLPDQEREMWGEYYEHRPYVIAIRVKDAVIM